MLSYHNDPDLKAQLIAQMRAHREAGQLVKGQYWENGEGDPLGCLVHTGLEPHKKCEELTGVPEWVWHVVSDAFERLPDALAMEWPERILTAIPVGKELETVRFKFQYRLLTDFKIDLGRTDILVAEVVGRVADLCRRAAHGKITPKKEWSEAKSAAWSASKNAGQTSNYAWALADSVSETVAGSTSAEATMAAATAVSLARAELNSNPAGGIFFDDYIEAAWQRIADAFIEILETAQ